MAPPLLNSLKRYATPVSGRRRCLTLRSPGPRWSKPTRELLPNGPLLDFFWSWRFLVGGLLAVICTPVPQARVFHAAATGFCGLAGSYAKAGSKASFVLTEHGIYTNERRMDLAVADWLFDSGAGGFDVTGKPAELRSDLFDGLSVLLAHHLLGRRRHNDDVPRQSIVSTL